jgi:hypothetical protein
MTPQPDEIKVVIRICREDDPRDVDETYGAGTYERLFPTCPQCEGEDQFCSFCHGDGRVTASQADEWERQNR